MGISKQVSAIESNHEFIRSVATIFKHKTVLPSRYRSFTRSLTVNQDESSVLNETWDMEFEPNESSDAVLYSLATFAESTKVQSISCNLVSADGKTTDLPILFETLEIKDKSNATLTAQVPYVRIPISARVQHIVLQFQINAIKGDKLKVYGQQLEMPVDTPVNNARLEIRTSGERAKHVSVESTGFRFEQHYNERSELIQEFDLEKKWNPTDTSSMTQRPKAIVSYITWAEIADEHAHYYQQEISSESNATPLFMDALHEIKNKSTSHKEIAYSFFKWIGKNLAATDSGLNFSLGSKYTPRAIEEILKTRHGDCKDFALIYIKLLAEFNIYAEPVEVLVQDNYGSIPVTTHVPKEYAFNHVIVFIPELNEYVDPTLSDQSDISSENFLIASSIFSNSYGMHLFSKKFSLIRPDLNQKEISITTKISKLGNQWIGETTWLGKGKGYHLLSLINARRDKMISEGGDLNVPFQKNNSELVPSTWHFDRDDLSATGGISFSYLLKDPPVNDDHLLYIPSNILSSVLLKYEMNIDMQSTENFCFDAEVSDEQIEIEGVKKISMQPEMANVRVSGVNSEYSQVISNDHGSLILKRHFSVSERRPFCSASEVREQNEFYDHIKKINAATYIHNQ